jgi:hypothetical protein
VAAFQCSIQNKTKQSKIEKPEQQRPALARSPSVSCTGSGSVVFLIHDIPMWVEAPPKIGACVEYVLIYLILETVYIQFTYLLVSHQWDVNRWKAVHIMVKAVHDIRDVTLTSSFIEVG